MPYSASLSVKTLTGKFTKYPGQASSGLVQVILPGYYLRSPVDNEWIAPFTVLATLDGTGSFSIPNMPASDDPDWSTIPFAYKVLMTIDGKTTAGTAELAAAGPATVDIADVFNAGPPADLPKSVTSVFGRVGLVVAQTGDYTKAQVGLASVDNTSDIGKPVSTAQQTALNLKVDISGGSVDFTRAATAQLRVTPTGNAAASTSVGGAFNITNTANTGAGLVVFSGQAAPTGHLVVVRTNSPTWNQSGVFVDYVGTQHGVNITHAGTGANSSGLNVVSSNPGNSAVSIVGAETGRGTIKATHTGQADGSDASASCLSLDIRTLGTAAQGIFVTATDGATTGNLLTLRNTGRDDFVVKGSGRVGVGVPAGAAVGAVVDVRQNDDVTVGLRVRAFSGASSDLLTLEDSANVVKFRVAKDGALGFNGSAAIAKPAVTGSRGGNAALASLLTALASYGLITDSSTA